MKNLKKFAALLLVGAMALLMLTACGGGGGGGSVNNPEEQKVLNQIGNQKGVHVTSDAELRAVAEKTSATRISKVRLAAGQPCKFCGRGSMWIG